MSSLTWLDYSEHDRRIALDAIDQFKEQETRDVEAAQARPFATRA